MRRNEIVNFRVTSDEKEILKKAMRKTGHKQMGTFLRELIFSYIEAGGVDGMKEAEKTMKAVAGATRNINQYQRALNKLARKGVLDSELKQKVEVAVAVAAKEYIKGAKILGKLRGKS